MKRTCLGLGTDSQETLKKLHTIPRLFSKERGDTFYLIIDLYSDSRQHSLSIKSKEKVCERLSRVCSCGFFLMESRSQVRCRLGGHLITMPLDASLLQV